jgi:hypothetical protein
MTPGPGAAERKRVFRAAQVGDEGLDDPLVVGEPDIDNDDGRHEHRGHGVLPGQLHFWHPFRTSQDTSVNLTARRDPG